MRPMSTSTTQKTQLDTSKIPALRDWNPGPFNPSDLIANAFVFTDHLRRAACEVARHEGETSGEILEAIDSPRDRARDALHILGNELRVRLPECAEAHALVVLGAHADLLLRAYAEWGISPQFGPKGRAFLAEVLALAELPCSDCSDNIVAKERARRAALSAFYYGEDSVRSAYLALTIAALRGFAREALPEPSDQALCKERRQRRELLVERARTLLEALGLSNRPIYAVWDQILRNATRPLVLIDPPSS